MSEPVGTQNTIRQLEAWANNDALIAPDHFACPHYGGCNASINQELREGEGCCMSYVGPQYDSGFRLAIVGMDHGEFELSYVCGATTRNIGIRQGTQQFQSALCRRC